MKCEEFQGETNFCLFRKGSPTGDFSMNPGAYSVLLFSVLVMGSLCFALYLSSQLPDRYYLAKGETFSIGDNKMIQAVSSSSYPLSVYSSAGNTFQMDLKLFGLINIKDVNVQVVDRRVVSLCGTPFGIKMVTDGVMVVGTGNVTDMQSQSVNPAKEAGIQEGDVILSVNGEKISSKKQLTKLVSTCGATPISITVRRGNDLQNLTVSPVKSSMDNDYHLGLWVRDSSAGIGTMTFFDPNNGCFAGLGHAICDVDTGQIMPLSQGEIVEASIIGVQAGSAGSPGQLQGAFVADQSGRSAVSEQLQRCLRQTFFPSSLFSDHPNGTKSGSEGRACPNHDHCGRGKAASV